MVLVLVVCMANGEWSMVDVKGRTLELCSSGFTVLEAGSTLEASNNACVVEDRGRVWNGIGGRLSLSGNSCVRVVWWPLRLTSVLLVTMSCAG